MIDPSFLLTHPSFSLAEHSDTLTDSSCLPKLYASGIGLCYRIFPRKWNNIIHSSVREKRRRNDWSVCRVLACDTLYMEPSSRMIGRVLKWHPNQVTWGTLTEVDYFLVEFFLHFCGGLELFWLDTVSGKGAKKGCESRWLLFIRRGMWK